MSEEQHEQQSRDIRNIELRMERAESRSLSRDEKMDSLVRIVENIDKKMDSFISSLPKEYMTIREFEAYKNSVDKLLAERKDGNKSWQSWVMTLMPYIMSAILGLYVIFGGG
jgi:predicted RNase H-like nuclease (RuvC/YqgF family)